MKKAKIVSVIVGQKGGPGSGFHGHAGRQGKRGGSAATGGMSSVDKLFAAAKVMGEDLYKEDMSGFIVYPSKPVLRKADANDILKLYEESGVLSDMASWDEIKSAYDIDLMDEWEFAFAYDPKTGEASHIIDVKKPVYDNIRENAEAYTAADINRFYELHPDKLLVSYGLFAPTEGSKAEHTLSVWPKKITINKYITDLVDKYRQKSKKYETEKPTHSTDVNKRAKLIADTEKTLVGKVFDIGGQLMKYAPSIGIGGVEGNYTVALVPVDKPDAMWTYVSLNKLLDDELYHKRVQHFFPQQLAEFGKLPSNRTYKEVKSARISQVKVRHEETKDR